MSRIEGEFKTNNTSGKQFRWYCLCILLACTASDAKAQWKKVLDVPPVYGQWFYPRVISFNQYGVGFIGVESKTNYVSPSVFRSTDGGMSWQSVSFPAYPWNPTGQNVPSDDFSFKDSLTGWAAAREGLFITTDGGSNWNLQLGQMGVGANQHWLFPRSVFYNKGNGLLMSGSWDGIPDLLVISSDNGITWQDASGINIWNGYNGFAFVSDSIGIVWYSAYPTGAQLYRTTDGGYSWQNKPGQEVAHECWQPLAYHRIFYALQDVGTNLIRSTDSGVTWSIVHTFDTSGENFLTGCIAVDSSGDLFIQKGENPIRTELQSLSGRTNGMYMSRDSGKSWISICGPYGTVDTRFCVFQNKVFAMDYESGPDTFANYSTYTNGRVWMLDLTIPWRIHVDSNLTITGKNCEATDAIFHFGSTYPCFDAVTLDSVTIKGSQAFRAQSEPYQQAGIDGEDSIIVHYQSQNPFDTAELLFHFTVNGVPQDSAATVYGIGTPDTSHIFLDSSLTIVGWNCQSTDSLFHFASSSPCLNAVKLDSITIVGSDAFTTELRPSQFEGIHGEDSITVHYQSQSHYDTAKVIFHFTHDGVPHDSAVIIYGISMQDTTPPIFTIRMRGDTTVSPGDSVGVIFVPGAGTLAATDSVSLTLRYDPNALSAPTLTLPGGWWVADSIWGNGTLTLVLRSDSAEPLPSPILQAKFKTYLTPSESRAGSPTYATFIYLDSAQSFFPQTTPCTPTTLSLQTPGSVEIDFTGCGDSTLAAAMEGQLPFSIESIVPNPATATLRVEGSGQGVEVELSDALGRTVIPSALYPLPFTLDVSRLPSGTYFLRLSQNGYVQTREVSIEH